jgi:hypothetical protein
MKSMIAILDFDEVVSNDTSRRSISGVATRTLIGGPPPGG